VSLGVGWHQRTPGQSSENASLAIPSTDCFQWNGVKVEKLDDEDYEEWRDDPYPPFQEKLVNTEPMTSTVRAKSSLTTLASTQVQSPTLHTTSTSSTLGPSPRLASKAIAPAEDMCSAQHQEAGIPVGHAKPHCCRDPNIRPVVYVIFNSTGNLSAYMPGKVARRTVANGDAKISLRDIDYDPAFLDVRYEEQRNVAIRHELQAKLAEKRQTVPGLQLLLPNSAPKRKHARSPGPSDNLTPHDDSMNSRSAMGEGIIIGHAAVGSCRDPSKPPPVWAALSSTGALCAYIPAKDSLRAFARGCAQINMENVVFCAEYRGLSQAKRIEHIKEIVRSNQKSNDEHRRRCKRKSEEYASGGEVLMDVEREQKFWCTEVPKRGLGCFSEALVGK
jgi:hypothetical protein